MTAEAAGRAPAGLAILAAHFGLIAMQERVEAWLPLTDPAEGLRP
jgi:hypothetical protein